jgi:hypothetical protein
MAMVPEAARPTVNADNKPTGWLVGALTTFGLLLSAVGIGTGDVPRMLRNEAPWAIATFSLVIAASICAASAGWLTTDDTKERWWLRASAGLLALAALAALATGIASARERPEPTLTAQILTDQQGHSALHFEVKDSGLQVSDKMTVLVSPLVASGSAAARRYVALPALYGASLGPDSSGSVDHSGNVPVPPAPITDIEVQAWIGERPTSCYARTTTTGCTTLHITRQSEEPQLTLAWHDAAHSAAGLGISLSAHDIAGKLAVLRIVDAESHRTLLSASWPPNATGSVVQSITAIIPRSTHRLCVAASSADMSPACLARSENQDAWVFTTVPPY